MKQNNSNGSDKCVAWEFSATGN